MKADNRLSSVLHVLLHMIELDEPLTSDDLSQMLTSHPVVVRRTLAGLREAGLVRSEKGHGGGWVMDCDPAKVSLYDIHQALGAPALISIGHRNHNPSCLVEAAVNAALDNAIEEAEALLIARFKAISLADLSAGFHKGLTERVGHLTLEDLLHNHPARPQKGNSDV
ncbi:MAG: Rrf2 family transcriptional regulator [Asticcacaulis sp.]